MGWVPWEVESREQHIHKSIRDESPGVASGELSGLLSTCLLHTAWKKDELIANGKNGQGHVYLSYQMYQI